MTRQQMLLVGHGLAAAGVTALAVPLLTEWDSQLGFLFALALPTILFALPVIWLHLRQREEHLFSERLRWRDWFVPVVLLVQVGVVAGLVFFPKTETLTTHGAMLACLVALLVAPAEEVAWRGGFLAVFRDRPRLGLWLGWTLSVLAAAPLLLANGIVFHGWSWLWLAIGATTRLLWSALAWRTGSVFYTAIAHVLTATLMLWVLVNENQFVAPHP